ncbi:MAG: transposase, partial [Streptosporangiaceae bacterium]
MLAIWSAIGENWGTVFLDREHLMTLGRADRQGNLLDDVELFCDQALDDRSIYTFLHRERDRLFPDEDFADLFDEHGRRSVPPSVVATVMVLQRLEGLSDREAVERFCFDARWRYAAGVGGYDTGAWTEFAHTVLVDMRARLSRSERPNRIFEIGLEAAQQAGLVGRRRVLDSTPLYDAVATMDSVTLIRSAIRGLLKAADETLEAELRAGLRSGDDYASAAKPQIDWDDEEQRQQLIDSRANDAWRCLAALDGRGLDPLLIEAARLLATVVGQDLDMGEDGIFRVARKVAKDRVISTVDPDARHGHKTAARGFDGYKGHVAVDPDSEIITATAVTPGNASDAAVAEDLISDLLEDDRSDDADDTAAGEEFDEESAQDPGADTPVVYGDNAYGTGAFQERLEDADIESRCKTQRPTIPGGLFTKDRFEVNLDDDTVTCPAAVTVNVRRHADGGGMAYFGHVCATCRLREKCTTATAGRTIGISAHEAAIARARRRQADAGWQDDYRA